MDSFLHALEQDSRARFSKESFEIDTSGFSDEVPAERWRIQPLPAAARDKLIACVQAGEYYKGIATALVNRAYKVNENGRRFRPTDIEGLMKNPDFLDWIAEEIKFQADFEWMVMDGDEEKKASKEIHGTGASST